MSIDLVAGPALYSVCHPEPQQWARSLVEWRDALQRLGLRPHLAPDCWAAAAKDDSLASFEGIQTRLGADSAFAGAVIQVLASLLGLLEPYATDIVLYDWSSTGCLHHNPCRSSATEVVTVAASLQPRRVGILAAETPEIETIEIEKLEQTDDDLDTIEVSFRVECFASPADLLAALDTADYVDRPDIAIAIALDQLLPGGSARPEFQVLPQLAPSLARLTLPMRRSAISTMASALLPVAMRPRGLEEHAIRTGEGGNDPQVTSRWGKAQRATISKRGAGWRVHYWRGAETVTFSNVCVHASLEIFE